MPLPQARRPHDFSWTLDIDTHETHTNIDIMEEYNQQSLERIDLLNCLQEAIGGAPPHFWAACQICDLKALERMIKCGREYPEMFRGFAQQTYTMAHYCK